MIKILEIQLNNFIDKCEYSFGEVLHKLSQEKRITFLSERKSQAKQYLDENGTLVDIRIGVKYEDNQQLGLEKFFKSITNSHLPNTTIRSFFNGRYHKRQLNIISDLLADYSEVNEDIETIHFDHFNHRIALLQELGVIEHLRTKYNIREVDNKKMIPILVAILGIEDKTVINNLRISLGAIGTNTKNDPIKSEKSKTFIREVLAKLDFPMNHKGLK